MDKDEIIRMAREAGAFRNYFDYGVEGFAFVDDETLERFAALVAEPWIETNKALANEIIELKKQVDISALPIIIEAAVKEAVLAEREACAHIAGEEYWDDTIAEAIRARGD